MGSPPDEAFESRPPESGGARDHQGNEAPSGHLDDEEATPRRRLLGLGLGLLCAVGLVGAGVGWYFGADYREIPAGGVDAIVVLGGGGQRFEEGVALVQEGVAPELVVFRTIDPTQRWQAAHALCARWDPVPATCLEPDPSDTRGEAMRLGLLIEDRGWSDVIVVVSNDQARRAGSLVRRCAPDEVEVHLVGVEHPHPFAVRAGYETAALLRDRVLQPGC